MPDTATQKTTIEDEVGMGIEIQVQGPGDGGPDDPRTYRVSSAAIRKEDGTWSWQKDVPLEARDEDVPPNTWWILQAVEAENDGHGVFIVGPGPSPL